MGRGCLKILDITKVRETAALREMKALEGNHSGTGGKCFKCTALFPATSMSTLLGRQVTSFARAVPNSPYPSTALTLPQRRGDLQDVPSQFTNISCTHVGGSAWWAGWPSALPPSQHYILDPKMSLEISLLIYIYIYICWTHAPITCHPTEQGGWGRRELISVSDPRMQTHA